MLAQKFKRKAAKAHGRKVQNFLHPYTAMNGAICRHHRSASKRFYFAALRLCGFALILFSFSCGSRPTDLRTVIPGDALVYLESNDLGKTLAAVTENKSFRQLAKTQPDLSALDGIQLAVAVTGFETSEQQVTDDQFVGKITPRFVAVVETNAWNFQALSFTENKLGEFINQSYGGEVQLETSNKHDGKYFIWTALNGRKAYALVQGSVIFFGNDETAIEKCLTVKRGEADSAAKNSKITAGEHLAFGYISTDGVAQISNLVGIQLAMGASEESEVKSFIARVLPEILRNSVTGVSWTAVKSEQGIEDKLTISTNSEVSTIFNETLSPSGTTDANLAQYLPAEIISATRYDLKDAQIAWRSVLLIAQKQTDAVSGNLIAAFSDGLFDPYGIGDAEMFLSAAGSQILTAKFDVEGENVVVIATVKDAQKVKNGIAKEINFTKLPGKADNAEIWRSEDGDIAAAFIEDKIIIGDSESVLKCLRAKQSGENVVKHEIFKEFAQSTAVAVTSGKDFESAGKIVELFSDKKTENETIPLNFSVETRINQNGIERQTVSDFGLIGTIIEQFGKE